MYAPHRSGPTNTAKRSQATRQRAPRGDGGHAERLPRGGTLKGSKKSRALWRRAPPGWGDQGLLRRSAIKGCPVARTMMDSLGAARWRAPPGRRGERAPPAQRGERPPPRWGWSGPPPARRGERPPPRWGWSGAPPARRGAARRNGQGLLWRGNDQGLLSSGAMRGSASEPLSTIQNKLQYSTIQRTQYIE